jgi:excinuclease ABC subunit A
VPTLSAPESIRLRGVRQNNLQGFDLDLPLGQFIVVTGLSGAGKSSLVFDTLHAEGQRRYVETFSAYTRQFLDLLDKPKVDRIENIRPSIAIEQSNTVKTSRSTVGTMTEVTDFAKVWFSHVAECYDPATGEKVEDDNPQTIWAKTHANHPAATLLLCFRIAKPDNLKWSEVLTSIKGQGYTRILAERSTSNAQRPTPNDLPIELHKIDDVLAGLAGSKIERSKLNVERWAFVYVIQDRLAIVADNKSRFVEATESALHFGKGEVFLFSPHPSNLTPQTFLHAGHYSRGLHSPKTGRTFRPATPGLFSFNSPLGACPKCRGFGRVIDIDYRLAIPDHSCRSPRAPSVRGKARSTASPRRTSFSSPRRSACRSTCPSPRSRPSRRPSSSTANAGLRWRDQPPGRNIGMG